MKFTGSAVLVFAALAVVGCGFDCETIRTPAEGPLESYEVTCKRDDDCSRCSDAQPTPSAAPSGEASDEWECFQDGIRFPCVVTPRDALREAEQMGLYNADADPLPIDARAFVLREPLAVAVEHCAGRCAPDPVSRFGWENGATVECTCVAEHSL